MGKRVRGTSQSTRAWQRKGAHGTLETEQIVEKKRACALHVRQSSATGRVLQKEDGREGHWAQEDLPSGTWSCGKGAERAQRECARVLITEAFSLGVREEHARFTLGREL